MLYFSYSESERNQWNSVSRLLLTRNRWVLKQSTSMHLLTQLSTEVTLYGSVIQQHSMREALYRWLELAADYITAISFIATSLKLMWQRCCVYMSADFSLELFSLCKEIRMKTWSQFLEIICFSSLWTSSSVKLLMSICRGCSGLREFSPKTPA